MSANGRLAARPETASWNAPSTSSRVSASTMVPPWTSGSKPRLARNSGSRSTATFTLTVPLRDFHCVIVSTKSSGSADGSICSRKVIFGCVAAITTSARSSSPDSSTTPRALPSRTSMRATLASVRTVAPNDSAALRNAPVTPPIPPRGKPHVPSSPSPTSPILWCAITYAVPAERGPAHVPMTPLTDRTPRIGGDSNQSSSRSEMLLVNRRVTSATPGTPNRRNSHASRP